MFRSFQTRLFTGIALAALTLTTCSSSAFAAANNSTPANVALSATLGESLTISASGGPISFALTNGSTIAGSGAVTISSSWVLLSTRTNVKIYGYFSDGTAALTDTAGDKIPSSAVLGQVPGQVTTFTAFSSAVPFGAGSGLQLDAVSLSSTNDNYVVTNHQDTLNLEIATPADLPAGSYSGTLVIQAQAN